VFIPTILTGRKNCVQADKTRRRATRRRRRQPEFISEAQNQSLNLSEYLTNAQDECASADQPGANYRAHRKMLLTKKDSPKNHGNINITILKH
jgi:hypothetical protein